MNEQSSGSTLGERFGDLGKLKNHLEGAQGVAPETESTGGNDSAVENQMPVEPAKSKPKRVRAKTSKPKAVKEQPTVAEAPAVVEVSQGTVAVVGDTQNLEQHQLVSAVDEPEPTQAEPMGVYLGGNDLEVPSTDLPPTGEQPRVLPEPHPVHRSPATAEEREKQAFIERLVQYLAPEIRLVEAERLYHWDSSQIEKMIRVFDEEYGGDPTYRTGLEQMQAYYTTLVADPVHRAAVRDFENQGGTWSTMVTEISRAVGSSVVIDKLTHSEYRSAARAAFEDLSVLSRAVQQVEPYLLYYQAYESVAAHDPNRAMMPPSLSRLLWICKSIGVHVKASVSSAEQHEKYRQHLQRQLDERSNQIASLREKIDNLSVQIARDTQSFTGGPFFVYHAASGKFLSKGDQSANRRLVIKRCKWVDNYSQAISFDERSKALTLLDSLLSWQMHCGARYLKKNREAMPDLLFGVPVAEIKISSMLVHRPVA